MSDRRSKRRQGPWILFIASVLIARFGEQWLHSLLLYLSTAPWARRMVTNFGPAWLVATSCGGWPSALPISGSSSPAC